MHFSYKEITQLLFCWLKIWAKSSGGGFVLFLISIVLCHLKPDEGLALCFLGSTLRRERAEMTVLFFFSLWSFEEGNLTPSRKRSLSLVFSQSSKDFSLKDWFRHFRYDESLSVAMNSIGKRKHIVLRQPAFNAKHGKKACVSPAEGHWGELEGLWHCLNLVFGQDIQTMSVFIIQFIVNSCTSLHIRQAKSILGVTLLILLELKLGTSTQVLYCAVKHHQLHAHGN